MPRVAIVIVTHNSAAEIGGCLDALRHEDAEIVVVDNASKDETGSEISKRAVRLIANPSNAGFAAAVNQGVRATTAPFVLLLNPDAHLLEGLEEMTTFAEESAAAAVGGKLIDKTGQPQAGFMARSLPTPGALIFEVLGVNRMWPRNPVNWNYRCMGLDVDAVTRVEQPAGAFLMFTRRAWEAVGGFDESFWPIWFEDVDFCARLNASGFCTYYYPKAVAVHAGAHSIDELAFEQRERYWYGSLLEYAAGHFSWLAFQTICATVALGAVLRAAKGFPHLKFKAFAVYGGIVGLALSRAFIRRRSTRVSVV